MSQPDRIAKLLTRRNGCTAMDIITIAGTCSPHRRLADLKERGWIIVRKPVAGANYGRYFGVAPGCYFEESGKADRKALAKAA